MLLTTTKQENFLSKDQKTEFFERVNKLLKCPPISHYSNHNQTKDPLIALVNIGQAVAAEKNIDLIN